VRVTANRPSTIAMFLGAALVLTIGVHDAAARRRGERVTATVNGKHIKWGAKKLTVPLVPGAVNFVAVVRRPHLHQVIRGLSFSCIIDLTTSTFPVTPVFPQICVLGYIQGRFDLHQNYEMWGATSADNSVEVTFDSFDGRRLTGTFRGTLAAEIPTTNPPATVENGTFAIDIGG
jgi:hypothetical protein